MEDDGPAGARSRDRGAATARPVRAARRGRLGLGHGQGFVWLIIIIFILGYLPDRAYYLTVGRTVDLGVLAWSPINLCPPTNQTLPCPAPVGAVVPWADVADRAGPAGGRGPTARSSRSGTLILYFGGSDGKTAHRHGLRRPDGRDRQLRQLDRGPELPAPRADASVVVRGWQHLRHRRHGCDGKPRPTRSSSLSPERPDRRARRVDRRPTTCSSCRRRAAGAAAAVTPDGLLLVGGRNAAGPVATTWKTLLDNTGKLSAWSVEQPLVTPQTDATAALIGDYLWLYGGSDANGPVGAVQRGVFGQPAAEGLPANPNQGKLIRWDINNQANLPVARTERVGLGAPTARSTSPAATTAAVRRTRSTGRSRPTPVISRSGSTSTPATCPRPASRAPRRSSTART